MSNAIRLGVLNNTAVVCSWCG